MGCLVVLASAAFGADPSDPVAGRSHWAFQPLAQKSATHSDWSRSVVDDYLIHQLRANGLRPAQEADRSDVLRRIHFQLVGGKDRVIEPDKGLISNSPGQRPGYCVKSGTEPGGLTHIPGIQDTIPSSFYDNLSILSSAFSMSIRASSLEIRVPVIPEPAFFWKLEKKSREKCFSPENSLL